MPLFLDRFARARAADRAKSATGQVAREYFYRFIYTVIWGVVLVALWFGLVAWSATHGGYQAPDATRQQGNSNDIGSSKWNGKFNQGTQRR